MRNGLYYLRLCALSMLILGCDVYIPGMNGVSMKKLFKMIGNLS